VISTERDETKGSHTFKKIAHLPNRPKESAFFSSRAIKARFAQLGLDVATREQQTPQGLAAFQNAEMDKWWPIIKAAGIRGE
jgi:hypothetical protein